ncbi:MAG: trypsin-like peptidase domain-containing protein, partial [bacterium]|nr:trypsin-like peptidase domain-containing protein [bacterium]
GQPVEPLFIKVAGEEVEASIIALGDRHHGLGDGVDLALIKLERVPYEARALRIGDFENVKIGQRVYVIGNSLGQGTCITSGIVSDKEREMEGKNLLMTDCAINGGNSGGPIFNADGEVIGAIVSSIPTAKGMNFAIPSKTVLAFIKAIEKQLKR